MFNILTTVILFFAIAFAQIDNETDNTPAANAAQNNNDPNTSSSTATTTASTTDAATKGPLGLPPGVVAMIPSTETTDSELYVPTTTATPSSDKPASFSYDPETTTEYAPSTTVYYEPTTTYPAQSTEYVTPIIKSTPPAVEHPVYSQSTGYPDYTGPYIPDVVRTESSDTNLYMPTQSPTKQYTYAPPPAQPTKETYPPPPPFTYAPTTPYESKPTTPIVYAPPSSKHETYPESNTTPIPVAPVPVSSGYSASFAIGDSTIRLGNTATINNTPVAIQTNSYGNTEIQIGTQSPSMIAYHSTPAPPAYPTPTSISTVYVQPHPETPATMTTSKIIPLYSETTTAKPMETTEGSLTYEHNTPSPTSTEHVMTYKGHTISIAGATLAAEPTGWMPEGGRAKPDAASAEGAGIKVGGRGWMCVAAAMVGGVVLVV